MFTIYIDNLLAELEKTGVDCFWNHHFVGAVCYADDVALLAPSGNSRECCPRNGQQLELSCIYLMRKKDPEIDTELTIELVCILWWLGMV